MSELKWNEQELSVSLGRVASACQANGRLYLVRHRDLATFRMDGERAIPWDEPVDAETRVHLDERNLQVAMDESGVLYVLLADGSIWRRNRETGTLDALSDADVRLAGHYAHRTGFVWDVCAQRLVIVGGDYRNDSYFYDPRERTLRPLPYGPGHGVGQTVASPHGVYRLVEKELWLLREERWTLVEHYEQARRDHGVLLFWSPQHDALFLVSEHLSHREAPFCIELTSDGLNPPLTLPGSFAGPLEAHAYIAAVDPEAQRFWCADRLGWRSMNLQVLGLEGGPPIQELAHARNVVQNPPVHWWREALALQQRDVETPPLNISVRDGWVVLATLPICPHLPLGEAGSLVLCAREDPYEHDPWTLAYDNAFEARIVDEVFPPSAGGLLLEETKYLEIEPIFAERVDTPHDGSIFRARGSKIGGSPALVQGTKEEATNAFVADLRCEDCEARLRFVAQLAWPEFDLISAVIYIYACPFGHSAVAHARNV